MAQLRGATSFSVRFAIPKTPKSCGRYYTKRLTIPRKMSGQTVWFQSVGGKPYRPCRSPKTYKGLKDGRHTFAVKAFAAAATSAPARVKFTIR